MIELGKTIRVGGTPSLHGPSLLRQAANFSGAVARHIAAGRPQATDEQVAARWAVCQANQCGLFRLLGEGQGQCLHKSCGCSLKMVGSESSVAPNKLRWADQKCPVGLWQAIDSLSPPLQ